MISQFTDAYMRHPVPVSKTLPYIIHTRYIMPLVMYKKLFN